MSQQWGSDTLGWAFLVPPAGTHMHVGTHVHPGTHMFTHKHTHATRTHSRPAFHSPGTPSANGPSPGPAPGSPWAEL